MPAALLPALARSIRPCPCPRSLPFLGRYDYLCAIPIGIFEGYAMLSFFEILVVYTGGEHKATLALAAQSRGGQHTCNFYYTCELCCTTPNLGKKSSGFCTCMRLGSSQELYRFLKLSVAQFCVIKPLVSVLMALWVSVHLSPHPHGLHTQHAHAR